MVCSYRALRDALEGKPLPPGGGVLADIVRTLLSMPRWQAVEIPGLLCTWVGEAKPIEMRDYLGRTTLTGRAGPFLVVRMSAGRS
jgi:hypothetical protein